MISRENFKDRCEVKFPENLPLYGFTTTALDDYRTEKMLVSAALHRIVADEENISVQVLGHSGKTALVKHLFNDALFRELFQTDNRLWDLPAAKGLSCVSFGRVEEPGMLLYDMPAGMVTLEKELTHMRSYRNYESRYAYDLYPEYTEYIENSDYIFDKEYPPYLLAGLLNSEALSCLFVVDAAADVTDAELEEELQLSVATLRERFQEKIVFVKTFEANLNTWDDAEKRARRVQLLDTLLGTDAISFDTETAEGLVHVAFEILKAHGAQGKLAEHMLTEMKCQRLAAAAQEISLVIFPAFLSETFIWHYDDEGLHGFCSFMARFLIHRLYTETETAPRELEERLQKRISAFTARLMDEPIIGWTAKSLARVCYFTYTLMYEMEKQNEPLLQGARAMVTETEGINWFTRKFNLPFEDNETPWLREDIKFGFRDKDEELWRGLLYKFYRTPDHHTALVVCQPSVEGYSLLSLMRASCVVNRHLTVARC